MHETLALCRGEETLTHFWRRMAKSTAKNLSDDQLNDLWIKDYEKSVEIDKDGVLR